jgi:hypothetical protein
MIGSLIAVAALASCAGTLAVTVRATSRLGQPEVFECAQRELSVLGYRPTAYDRDAGVLTTQKPDPRARRPHTHFRRVLDRLEVAAKPAADGSDLVVRARTMAEFQTQRGPTEEEEAASATARADARTLLERCGQ